MGSVQGNKLGKENASAVFSVLDGDGDGRLSRKVMTHDEFFVPMFIVILREALFARCSASHGAASCVL